MSRKRTLNLHLMLSEEEKDLIKKVATLRGMIVTNLILELVRKDYEKLIQRKEE